MNLNFRMKKSPVRQADLAELKKEIDSKGVPDTLTLSALNTDYINEKTLGHGVTIDGVRIVDGLIGPESIPPISYSNVAATGILATTAAPLSYGFNFINDASAQQRGVYLPIDVQEQDVYVINSTAEPIYVYGENAATSILKLDIKEFTTDSPYLILNQNSSAKFFRVGTRWVAEPFNGIKNKPLIYKAILTQSGTNAPVATVLNSTDANFLTGITFQRYDIGQYGASKIGVTNTNTLVNVTTNLSASSLDTISLEVSAMMDTIFIGTHVAGAYKDGISQMFVTIEYYG